MSWVGRTAPLTAALLLGGPALPQSSTTTQTFQVRGQPDASVELETDGCVVVNGYPAIVFLHDFSDLDFKVDGPSKSDPRFYLGKERSYGLRRGPLVG